MRNCLKKTTTTVTRRELAPGHSGLGVNQNLWIFSTDQKPSRPLNPSQIHLPSLPSRAVSCQESRVWPVFRRIQFTSLPRLEFTHSKYPWPLFNRQLSYEEDLVIRHRSPVSFDNGYRPVLTEQTKGKIGIKQDEPARKVVSGQLIWADKTKNTLTNYSIISSQLYYPIFLLEFL